MFAWSGLDRSKFAPIAPGGIVIGSLSPSLAAALGLPAGIPIVAGGHDQCPTALGCGCVEAGMAACGLGTFQCIAPLFEMPADPLKMLRNSLNIENHVLPDLYIAFVYNQAGALVKWFRNTFAADHRDEEDIYERLNKEIPREPTDVLVLPHFEPPQWPGYVPDSAGAILGLRTDTTRGEILQSIMECASLYLLPGAEALKELGQPLKSLVAVGGGAKSDAWVQINADIFGLPVVRPRNSEAGLVGAAMLAGLATGVYGSAAEAAARRVKVDRVFEPRDSNHAFYAAKSRQLAKVYPALRGIVS
jgi:xylulokinase